MKNLLQDWWLSEGDHDLHAASTKSIHSKLRSVGNNILEIRKKNSISSLPRHNPALKRS
jgi:hypothetical protein